MAVSLLFFYQRLQSGPEQFTWSVVHIQTFARRAPASSLIPRLKARKAKSPAKWLTLPGLITHDQVMKSCA